MENIRFKKTFAEIKSLIESNKKVTQFIVDGELFYVMDCQDAQIGFVTLYVEEGTNKVWLRSYRLKADNTCDFVDIEITKETAQRWGQIIGTIEEQADLMQKLAEKQDSTDTRLETESKTVVGAINEINARDEAEWGKIKGNIEYQEDLMDELAVKQNESDTRLETESKTVVGAINELNARDTAEWGKISGNIEEQQDLAELLLLKQSKQDNNLTTEAKSIVPAINELNEKVAHPQWGDIEGQITEQSDLADELDKKQDSYAEGLATDSKYIVPAINECFNKFVEPAWGSIKGRIDQQQDLMDEIGKKQDNWDGNLRTDNKSVVGAINELLDKKDAQWGQITGDIEAQLDLHNKFMEKQDAHSEGLVTANKYIVPAINEVAQKDTNWGQIKGTLANQTDLASALSTKQDMVSQDLETDNKSIVGAINELKARPAGYIEWGDIQGSIDNQTDLRIRSISPGDEFSIGNFFTVTPYGSKRVFNFTLDYNGVKNNGVTALEVAPDSKITMLYYHNLATEGYLRIKTPRLNETGYPYVNNLAVNKIPMAISLNAIGQTLVFTVDFSNTNLIEQETTEHVPVETCFMFFNYLHIILR